MAWENTLLPASFRGIFFEVVSTGDEIERATVAHEYPYVDGANVEDMGRLAGRISMTAVFYGDDYEIKLKQLMEALDTPGVAELIHPVFGSIQAQFIHSSIPHDAWEPDFSRVTLEFLESNLRAPLFDRVLPLQQVDAVNDAADTALEASQNRFELDIGKALNLPALLKDKLSADMLGVMGNMRNLADQLVAARGWIASGLYYLNNPLAFVDELTGGLISRVKAIFSPMNLRLSYSGGSSFGSAGSAGTSGAGSVAGASGTAGTSGFGSTSTSLVAIAPAGYARGSLATVWKEPLAYLKRPLLTQLPAPSSTPTGPMIWTVAPDGVPTQPFLVAHVTVQMTVAIASAAAEVFALDLAESILAPADIETIAADTRSTISSTITLLRLTFPNIVESRPITEALKVLALRVTDAAEQLIRARPPLIERVVATPGNLQLLAHLWYGDYRRADELLRMNPQIVNPNIIRRGDTLRAYAV